MPRVTTVKSARKSQGTCGKCGARIKEGDTYRWWKFRYGGRRVRCAKPECTPRASDLTQSAFYGQLYDLQDSLDEAIANKDADALRSIADDLRSLGEECSSSRDNMPEGLQDSDTGELLQTRADECESRADELESAADERESLNTDDWEQYAEDNSLTKNEGESDEDFESRVTEAMDANADSEWEIDVDLSID